MSKVIGYIRVSTGRQATEGVSMEAQERKVRAWAEINGYDEVVIFEDAGISGKKASNRHGLQAALEATSKGDALVVYSLSRLARSTMDAMRINERLEKKGADLVSISESLDTTTAAGRMVFRVLAAFAEFESEVIGERTAAAWGQKRIRGEKTGGSVPFGYTACKGKLIEHGGEQATIEFIRCMRSKGATLREIGAALEAEGIKTKSGGSKWNSKTVSGILKRAERTEMERAA